MPRYISSSAPQRSYCSPLISNPPLFCIAWVRSFTRRAFHQAIHPNPRRTALEHCWQWGERGRFFGLYIVWERNKCFARTILSFRLLYCKIILHLAVCSDNQPPDEGDERDGAKSIKIRVFVEWSERREREAWNEMLLHTWRAWRDEDVMIKHDSRLRPAPPPPSTNFPKWKGIAGREEKFLSVRTLIEPSGNLSVRAQ